MKDSQDKFQKAMDEMIGNLDGVISIADDIVVTGRTKEEHDSRLHDLMKRAETKGIVFNKDKCKINTDSVKFFGNIYDKNGRRPDPEMVDAIIKLENPKNKKDLQIFLGMTAYLMPYIPHLSELTTDLRKIMSNENEFSEAVKAVQLKFGMPADSYPTPELLQRLGG